MSKLKWQKVRAGLYFTKYDNHILAVVKIEATDVNITGWWIIEIYDIKGKFIEQLDAYFTLREAKLAAVRDYKNWKK
jgi:hypothetical protein